MTLVAAFENRDRPAREELFNQRYIKQFRQLPEFSSLYSYEAIMLFARAAQEAGSLETDRIKESILSMPAIQGIRDTYQLTPSGDAIRRQSVFIIQNGSYVLAETP